MAYSPEARKQKYEKKKQLMKIDPAYRAEQNRKRLESRKNRVTAKLLDIGFDTSKLDSGVCCFIDCTTKLSRYNQDKCCALHQNIVVKNGLNQIIEYTDVRGFAFMKQEF
jgi:hypothetical protein